MICACYTDSGGSGSESAQAGDMALRRSIPALALGTAGGIALRRRYLRWGARDDEVGATLPGDDIVAEPNVVATRAVSIAAPAAKVWPWIAQLGQERAGFYSYAFLENLVGCDIPNADRIVPEWQSVQVGDAFKLHPEMALTVAQVDPGRALVVRGGVPMGASPPPYDFSWAFVIIPESVPGTTRLVVRERYGYTRRWSGAVVEPVEFVSFVMSRRMLQGIRKRVEKSA